MNILYLIQYKEQVDSDSYRRRMCIYKHLYSYVNEFGYVLGLKHDSTLDRYITLIGLHVYHL